MSKSAERQLVAAVVYGQDLGPVLDLPADGFSEPLCGAVWASGVALAQQGRERSLAALEQAMRAAGTWSGGVEGVIAEATDRLSTLGPDLRTAAELVRDAHRRRQLRALGAELADAAKGDGDVEEMLQDFGGRLQALERGSDDGVLHVAEVLGETMRDIARRAKGEVIACPTGIGALDEALGGGLEPGCQYVVAARPGHGKSALAMGVAIAASAAGHPVLFFSVEMNAVQLGRRVFAHQGPVDLSDLKQPSAPHIWDRMGRVGHAMKAAPLHMRPANISLQQLRSITRRWHRKHCRGPKHGVVVVDYLQRMNANGKLPREQQIAELSGGIKGEALGLGVSTLVLAQLNRKIEDRPDKRPKLSDLRESGSIEQDADVVMMLYRAWRYDKSKDAKKAEILLPKQREGAEDQAVVAEFIPEHTRFGDWRG